MKVFLLVSFLLMSIKFSTPQKLLCKNAIFCQGDLLRVIQMSGIFKDSKTFVDMSLKHRAERILKNFDRLMAKTQGLPSKIEIMSFIQQNFQATHDELDNWQPPDHRINPPFLRKIKDLRIRSMAKRLVDIWPNLGRKIKPEVMQNPLKYSIIPVPNGFIVPGGRFREFYYWDSYWILKGLLICDMKITVKGMLENFFSIIDQYGFIPNGGRIYYLDRSQPPLLTTMVSDFMDLTNEIVWLKNNIHLLERELQYWITKKTVTVDKGGKKYRLARYYSFDDQPRPESFIEDVHTASRYRTDEEKRDCYRNIRTGAETGWDFSCRWFIDRQGGNRGDLSNLKPTRILPVDLNAFLCKSFKIMHNFYLKLHDKRKAKYWLEYYTEWRTAIRQILYSQEDGIWFDYDMELRIQRKHFYPSNFVPLWAETYDTTQKESYGRNATLYLKMKGIMEFEGGVPSSLSETGEQWDLPNAWAPNQAFVILGLDKTEDPSAVNIAHQLADRWLETVMKVAEETHAMFEKYHAMFKGMYGGGGEYEVQTGFGWTNGVVLEMIEHYFIKKKAELGTPEGQGASD